MTTRASRQALRRHPATRRPHPPPAAQRRRGWSRLSTTAATVLLIVALFLTATSYSRALGEPGYATVADKTSAWLHDHHLGPVVSVVENWMYTRHRPSREPADVRQFRATPDSATQPATQPLLPTLPVPAGAAGHPAWSPGYRDNAGNPLTYTARFEPDPTYPSVVAGVAIISGSSTLAHLGLGTSVLAANDPNSLARIPSDQTPALVAQFNSGFRFKDISGGLYFHHRHYRPLRDGQASAVIDDRGHLRIGAWGRNLRMASDIDTVRQNLDLIVDGGKALPSGSRDSQRWGGARLVFQYTWRSALGIDRNGNIVYIAGNQLNLETLARAAAQAGALTAMQLDMHRGNSLLTEWIRNPLSGHAEGRKLLDSMSAPADRYLTTDRRDFFYFTDADADTPPMMRGVR